MRSKTSLSRAARHCAELHVLYRRNFFGVHEKFGILRITTLALEGSMYLRECDGVKGQIYRSVWRPRVLHFDIGRAIRICLACIASDQGRWLPPKYRIDEF